MVRKFKRTAQRPENLRSTRAEVDGKRVRLITTREDGSEAVVSIRRGRLDIPEPSQFAEESAGAAHAVQ